MLTRRLTAQATQQIPLFIVIQRTILALTLAATPTWAQLVVAGSPPYDQATQTGFHGDFVPPRTSVNNSGTAVGVCIQFVGGTGFGGRAVRWNTSGSTQLVDISNDAWASSAVYAINDTGTAVGFAQEFNFTYYPLAMSWNAAGLATQLGDLGTDVFGRRELQANDINSVGTAVGQAQKYDPQGQFLGLPAVRWNSAAVPTELDALGYSTLSAEALSVNQSGVTVGYVNAYLNFDFNGRRAARWDQLGGVIELGNLGTSDGTINGATNSTAVTVNDQGTAVGYCAKFVDSNALGDRPVRWNAGSPAAIELDALDSTGSAFIDAAAYDINNLGTVVGFSGKVVGVGINANQGTPAVR